MRSVKVFREVAVWVDNNRNLGIIGPCDLLPHAHRFIAEIENLRPSEIRNFWAALNCAQDRFVLREVPATRGHCLVCGQKRMTFRRAHKSTSVIKPLRQRRKLSCNICGVEFPLIQPHYQCMTPDESAAPRELTQKFECPGVHCCSCYGKDGGE